MAMELSARLQAVADFVTAGYKMADIGTDHAYIPIFLTEQQRIPNAVAMDVNEGPLERARDHVKMWRMEEKICLRLSDGFSALYPGEVQSAVIAGMGGPLMMRILKEGRDTVEQLEECILQPQSEVDRVRAFLLQEGFLFIREDMVKDDGKYYFIMKVKPGKDQNGNGKQEWKAEELKYGKLLLEEKNEVLLEYLQKEIALKREILARLEGKATDRIAMRKKEIRQELELAEKGMKYYAL